MWAENSVQGTGGLTMAGVKGMAMKTEGTSLSTITGGAEMSHSTTIGIAVHGATITTAEERATERAAGA